MHKQNVVRVQHTNDNSIVSKVSTSSCGYFDDELTKHFIGKPRRRAPIINRGYYIRAAALDAAITSILKTHEKFRLQVISLGAGYDSGFFRYQNLIKTNDLYVDVDFSNTIMNKELLIRHSEVLHAMASKNLSYRLLGCDITDTILLESKLRNIGVDFNDLTLIILECVLSYIPPVKADGVLKWLASRFSNGVLLLYEQAYCSDGFGRIMCQHFDSLQAPLVSLSTYSTLESQHKRFEKCGFSSIQTITMDDFWQETTKEEQQRIFRLEPFDEHEEWWQKLQHYFLLAASIGKKSEHVLMPQCKTIPRTIKGAHNDYITSDLRSAAFARRYAHQVLFDSTRDQLFVFGGFGIESEHDQHKRLSTLITVDLSTWDIVDDCQINIDSSEIMGARMHQRVTVVDETPSKLSLLISGGRGSPAASPLPDVLCIINFSTEHTSCRFRLIEVFGSDVPSPRWRHTLTPLSNRRQVLYGGIDNTSKVFGTCHICHLEKGGSERLIWNEMSSSEPRFSHTATYYNGGIWIIGGLNADQTFAESCLVFDTTTQTWTSRLIEGFTPRFSHTVVCVDQYAIVIGGVLKGCPDTNIAVIDLEKGKCEEFGINHPSNAPPILLFNHCSFLRNDEIICVGGGGNCFSFGTHLNDHCVIFSLSNIISVYKKRISPKPA